MTINVANPVSRNWLGQPSIDLRHRQADYSHGGQHSETFDQPFLEECDHWANHFNNAAQNHGSNGEIKWIGDVGTLACKAGQHPLGRAFDLTYVKFGSSHINMDQSWRPGASLAHRRRYVATAAESRRFFGTVITGWYNADHHNHIHFDMGVDVTVIRTTARTDTTLVQASANYLNSASIAIDGAWGTNTENAFDGLMKNFGMECYSPKTNTTHARQFLWKIVQHGVANRSAGFYTASC